MNSFTLRRLRCLSTATGAPMSRLVDTAIDEFVERILKENSGIRDRYQKALLLAAEHDKPRPKLTIVK